MGTRTLDRLHHKPLRFYCSRCLPIKSFGFKLIADHYMTEHKKDDEIGICVTCGADRAIYLEQLLEPCWHGHAGAMKNKED